MMQVVEHETTSLMTHICFIHILEQNKRPWSRKQFFFPPEKRRRRRSSSSSKRQIQKLVFGSHSCPVYALSFIAQNLLRVNTQISLPSPTTLTTTTTSMIPKLKLAHFLIQSNSLLEATKNRGKKKALLLLSSSSSSSAAPPSSSPVKKNVSQDPSFFFSLFFCSSSLLLCPLNEYKAKGCRRTWAKEGLGECGNLNEGWWWWSHLKRSLSLSLSLFCSLQSSWKEFVMMGARLGNWDCKLGKKVSWQS